MAPIVPIFTIAQLTDLILQQYLGKTTGILNWQNFGDVANLAPRDDGAVVYAGCIWPISVDTPQIALRQAPPYVLYSWGIRLALAHSRASQVSSYCLFWAYKLSELLELATTQAGQEITTTNLSGVFNGVEVPAETVLDIQRKPWTITVHQNESGGATGMIQSQLIVRG